MARQLDDWIEGWLEFQENTEPPRQFVSWVAVSIIAAALQRKCVLKMGHLKLYPNMYIIIVGPSGSRKGTAMTPGRDIIEHKGIKLSAEATTREALIRALKHATGAQTTDQGTFQAHASLTIYSQELTSFMGYNNVQLMNDLTDLFDCRDTWNYDTKDEKKKDFINHVWVNMIGATTPETLHAALPMESIGGGFTSRIIFVYGDKKYKVVPFPWITQEALDTLEKLKIDLGAIYLMEGQFKYDQSFIDRYVAWRHHHEATPPFKDPRLGGYIDRKPAHLLKLSMILSASQSDNMMITKSIFDRALVMLEKTEKHMIKVYAGFGESKDSSVLSRVMSDLILAKDQGVDFAYLMSKYYYDADEDMMRRIWRTLATMPQFNSHQDDLTKEHRLYYIGEQDVS